MSKPWPEPSRQFIRARDALLDLTDVERQRLMAWIRRYVDEDGSIPLQGYHEHAERASKATPYFRPDENEARST